MIAMSKMPKSPRIERWGRLLRWGAGATVLALMPKCLLCAMAYVGLGAALGLTGPELCGATPSAVPAWGWLAGGVGVLVSTVLLSRRCGGAR
jgi:hypothetical protein